MKLPFFITNSLAVIRLNNELCPKAKIRDNCTIFGWKIKKNMEDVFKFLLVAAVIVIGLVKQFKKEANKNADKSPDIPMPDVDNPLPEYWGGDTYGGFIPEGPKPAEKPKPVSKPSAKSKHTSIKASPPSPASRPQESDEVTSEYGIHSAEEARKAIIWSEILQRKY